MNPKLPLFPNNHHFPRCLGFICLLAVWCISFFAEIELCADELGLPATVPEVWQEDAELTDVFFLNAQLGWAVGQHGICLRTQDGGLTWQRSVTRIPLNRGQDRITKDMKTVLDQVRQETSGAGDSLAKTDYAVANAPAVRLESVYFLNEKQGWAVGGYEIPYVSISRGAVFRTTDGGQTWKQVTGVPLPHLYRVKFPQAFSGWTLGSYSELLQANLLFSNDLGEKFRNEINTQRVHLVDGDALADGWIAIDRDGQLHRLNLDRTQPPIVTDGRTDRLRNVRMADGLHGWAVGDNGRVLATTDGGKSWQRPGWLTQYPLLSQFNLNAVAIEGTRVWFAGNPGSLVFCFDHQHSTFQAYQTGCSLPLNRLTFVNESLGIAVGGLGTILRTTDGGRNWGIVRGLGQEVAQLNVAFHSPDVSLETIGRWCDEEGYLSAVAVIAMSGESLPYESAFYQATQRLGSSLYLPLSARVSTDAEQSKLPELVLEKLVRTIRQLRPRVVVSPHAAVPIPGFGYLDCQEILDRAIRSAADRQQFPEHWQQLGLGIWQVDRLAVGSPSATDQVCELNCRQYLPRVGELLEDRVALSRALLGLPIQGTPLQTFQVLRYSAASNNSTNLYAGLLEIGRRLPQRSITEIRRGNLINIQDVFQKQQQIRALLQASGSTESDLRLWRQQVNQWTMSTSRESAGIWLLQLAEAYLQAGRLPMAEQALDYLCQYFPENPLAPASQWWLTQIAISAEAEIAKRSKRDAPLLAKANGQPPTPRATPDLQATSSSLADEDLELSAEKIAEIDAMLAEEDRKITTVQQTVESNGVRYTIWLPMEQSKTTTKIAGEAVSESELAQLESGESGDNQRTRHDLARQRMLQLRQRYPDLANTDGIRLLEARLLNRTGEVEHAQRILKQLAQDGNATHSTQRAAMQEIQSTSPESSRAVIPVTRLTQRPRLDAQFADWQDLQRPNWTPWQRVPSAQVDQTSALTPRVAEDQIALTYDEEFLFLAIRCRKLPQGHYGHRPAKRTADADLLPYDRIELSFDSDRDHAWPFRLGIDCRGWTFDHCGPAVDWNPQWFVAQSEDEQSWSIEAAIPWQHLAIEPPSAGERWYFGAARFGGRQMQNLWSYPALPASGTQALPILQSPQISEANGLLWFN